MAKTKKGSRAKAKVRTYPAYILAVALGVTMFIEGIIFGVATGPELTNALAILDMTGQVQQVASDLSVVIQPMAMAVSGIYQFYQLSATEVIVLFSNFDPAPFFAPYSAVFQFYQASANEMYKLLDLSSVLPLTI